MSDEGRLLNATNRAQQAKNLMEHELMVEAFSAIENEFIAFWKGTPVRDVEARERIWAQLQNLGKLKGHLENIIIDGKLAQRELNDIATLGERKKLFGIV